MNMRGLVRLARALSPCMTISGMLACLFVTALLVGLNQQTLADVFAGVAFVLLTITVILSTAQSIVNRRSKATDESCWPSLHRLFRVSLMSLRRIRNASIFPRRR